MSDGTGRVVLASRGLDPIGTGRQLQLAARGLVALGWEVHVALLSAQACLAGAVCETGATVHELSRRPSSGQGLPDAAVPLELARLLSRLDADVVEAWGWWSGIAAAAAAEVMRAGALVGRSRASAVPPLVLRVATPPGGSWARRLAMARSRLVLADGEGVAAACRARSTAAPVRSLPPGNPASMIAAADRAVVASCFGLRPERPWTLCVAPLEAPSRIERLLWAMDQLDVVHGGIEHVLIGTGSQASRLARRARVQEVAPRLHVFPSTAPARPVTVGDLVAHAAIVWQAGEVALGGAVFDALAAGRPAIAVDGVVARSLVEDGVNGRIVPAEPASEFPRHALRLLEDASLASRLGESAARVMAERFPIERFHEAHANALASVMGGRRPRSSLT